MHSILKNILQTLGIYHPLQSRYQSFLRSRKIRTYRIQYQSYQGSGFTCNVCGAMYSRFVSDYPSPENVSALEKNQVLAGYGEHIMCPACLSTARERLVIACLEKYIHPSQKYILHLSPERKVFAYLRDKAHIVTADLQPGFYRDIDPGILKQDATALDFPDASFDLVIANHVLEHIPDDRQAMREFFRVLKPGGKAILQVPYSVSLPQTLEGLPAATEAERSELYGQQDHVRIYALQDYIQRLRQAGFRVEELPDSERKAMERHATQPGEVFLLITRP